MGRQVGQLGQDGGPELVLAEQARGAVLPDDGEAVQQRQQRLEDLRQGRRGGGIGQEARGGCDGEGVQGPRQRGRVIVDVGELLESGRLDHGDWLRDSKGIVVK
jgi:hypothetical protein